MKSKHWLWVFAALPLVCVPLIAQEIAKDAKDAKTTAQDAKSAPASDAPEAASTDKPDPPDERVSADNNTSFPVDI